jgi:hypothetical protein
MPSTLGYDQPMGGIAQTAFVVEDLQTEIARYVRDCGAGPFFVLPNFLQPGQSYRGGPSTADVTIAMGFAGHMLIELIQPLDSNPSVYQEVINLRGYGFHHWGIAFEDVYAAEADYNSKGYETVYKAAVPTGGEVIFLDNGNGAHEGFLELLPVTPGMDETFTRFWKASLDWDGTDPVRSFL